MSKDILRYRVWDNVDEEYIENLDIFRLTPAGELILNNGYPVKELKCNPKRFKLESCTGFKDYNSKLIYEGDILYHPILGVYAVEFCEDKLGFVLRNNNPDCTLESLDITMYAWWIVDNIHKTPEFWREYYEVQNV